ncbi:MAG: hypothetical protein GIW99_11225, partial [Candidatus Eremiobacteraeota bacterium]|nr:hypothetical protein [Candidatus Eremiobacteraeota bacterium]
PPDLAAPSPTPAPLLINGQVIDLERGFLVFSSGDAFRLAPDVTIVDDATGGKPMFALEPGFYAVARLEPATSRITSVRVARHPLALGTPAAQIPRQYVAAASSPLPNPDLAPKKSAYSSKLSSDVLVSVTVQVPADTPYTDDIFMATDTSGWNARAIKLQRVDGLHFKIDVRLRGGTDFHYLFTRGSWRSVERDRAGLERQARDFFVPGGDAQTIDNTVYRWADLP